jgi:uridine kinase
MSSPLTLKLDEIVTFIKDRQQNTGPFVVLIDGPAGSGKTTLGTMLSQVLGWSLVSMDDFFLPLDLRSEERLSEPGGNVHYERFYQEVVEPIVKARNGDNVSPATYRLFSCITFDYAGEKTFDPNKPLIVEGSYSLHPYFKNYQDLGLFLSLDSKTQARRILARNGPEKAQVFRERWIPMENRYFDFYRISDRADLIFKFLL